MAEEILRTEGLCKRFGSLEVLRGVSISVFRQEIVSVIGPSGSGKRRSAVSSTGWSCPTSGKVFFHQSGNQGKRLEICRYRQKIGMIFQNFNVFPNMTVLENITLAPFGKKGSQGPGGARGYGVAEAGWSCRKSGGISPQAVRGPKAEAGHCPGYGHGTGGHAV